MKKLLFIAVFLLFLFPTLVFTHGLGQSFKKDVANYTVEFEYDEPEVLEGEGVGYVFRLLEKGSEKAVLFDSVFVTVEDKESRTVFAGRIGADKIQDGVGRETLTLNAGEFKFGLSFQKGDATLAETTFDQKVAADKEKQNNSSLKTVGGVIIGLIAGFGIAKLMMRGKKNVE